MQKNMIVRRKMFEHAESLSKLTPFKKVFIANNSVKVTC